jgi:hypothetical protein
VKIESGRREQREEILRTFPQRHTGRMRRTKVVGTSCGVYVRAESGLGREGERARRGKRKG